MPHGVLVMVQDHQTFTYTKHAQKLHRNDNLQFDLLRYALTLNT
jgi:hypothetical protein